MTRILYYGVSKPTRAAKLATVYPAVEVIEDAWIVYVYSSAEEFFYLACIPIHQ